MTVYFIGAGPGDPELITVKGQRLIRSCPVIIYAGSLVPAAVLEGHQAQQVVQKLRQAYASVDFADAIANLEHQPTLSIGVAERSAPQNLLTLPAIMSAADAALYDAKNANRNCVRVYQPKAA